MVAKVLSNTFGCCVASVVPVPLVNVVFLILLTFFPVLIVLILVPEGCYLINLLSQGSGKVLTIALGTGEFSPEANNG